MFRSRAEPDWFRAFRADVRAFAEGLTKDAMARVEDRPGSVSLSIEAISRQHRNVTLEAGPEWIDLDVGVFVLEAPFDAETAKTVLAYLDALRDGRVREVLDLDTGDLHEISRLASRGERRWLRDVRRAFRLRPRGEVRRVAVRRVASIPPRDLV